MTYQSRTQAFYGPDNPAQLRWRIELGKVSIWSDCDGIETDCVQADRLATRAMCIDLLRELDKQS